MHTLEFDVEQVWNLALLPCPHNHQTESIHEIALTKIHNRPYRVLFLAVLLKCVPVLVLPPKSVSQISFLAILHPGISL